MTQPLLAHDLPLSERNLKNRIVASRNKKRARFTSHVLVLRLTSRNKKKGETYVPRISFEINISKQKKRRDLRSTLNVFTTE